MNEAKKIDIYESVNFNPLSYYLSQISKIPLLSKKDEEELAIKAKSGDKIARDKLIRANLRFVVAVAKKYRNQGIPFSDLINEGNIGLLNAINKYEPERGYHFISYAVWWIRQAILKAICEKSRFIRLPLNRANELVKINKLKRSHFDKYEEEIELEKLAVDLNMNKDNVKHLLDISRDTLSLETPVYDNKNNVTYLGEFIADDADKSPEEKIESKSLNEAINSILRTLSDKERDIIELRFGLNGNTKLSLKEIGDMYSLTKERIRQIEKKALQRLRQKSKQEKLESFVK